MPRSAVLLGGSTIFGLGCYDGSPFGRLVCADLGIDEVDDRSAPSRFARDILADDVPLLAGEHLDLVILHIGSSEGLVIPGAGVQALIERFAPASWHGVAGLEPRAAFSRQPPRAARQRREDRIKRLVKRGVIFLTNGRPKMAAAEFEPYGRELVTTMSAASSTTVLVGMQDADRRAFPRTAQARGEVDAALSRIARETDGVVWVPLAGRLQPEHYLGDGLHLSAAGHRRVADLVLAALTEARPGR